MAEARGANIGFEPGSDLPSDIRARVRMPPGVTAEDALRAVMCTFFQHASSGDARDVFDALPKRDRALVGICAAHKGRNRERFGRDELAQRVAEHLHVSRGDAEDLASAVLTAVSARLPGGRLASVAARLPHDLQSLWVARRIALPRDPHPIITRIEASATLPDGVDGVAAFATITGLVSRRLTRGEARHLAENLPVDLAPLVYDYVDDRQQHAAHFDHEEYLNLVARELDTDDVDVVEGVARAVFSAVQEYLRSDIYEHVMRQLPVRLQELWAV
jgi:uncharacterized protein (DUF2267 family)